MGREKMKFLCDHMLGTLARWLRTLGFDTYFSPPLDDVEILKIAWREGRILLTRDAKIAPFGNVKILLIESTDLDEQLKQVLSAFDLEITDPMSRCSLCNTPIRDIDKAECEGKVPEGVFENQDEFWFCDQCEKYYWAGSHWDRIMKRVEELRTR
jgi:uncharacterized protein with PIN domain